MNSSSPPMPHRSPVRVLAAGARFAAALRRPTRPPAPNWWQEYGHACLLRYLAPPSSRARPRIGASLARPAATPPPPEPRPPTSLAPRPHAAPVPRGPDADDACCPSAGQATHALRVLVVVHPLIRRRTHRRPPTDNHALPPHTALPAILGLRPHAPQAPCAAPRHHIHSLDAQRTDQGRRRRA